MSFDNFLGQYIPLKGRTSRTYFWIGLPLILLLTVISLFALGFSIGIYGSFLKIAGQSLAAYDGREFARKAGTALIYPMVLGLLCLLSIRRFHDRGKSGFWSLILFVPVVGLLWYIVDCGILPGQVETNKYGDPPK